MARREDVQLEEGILIFLFVLLFLVFLVPALLIQSVREVPSHYESFSFRMIWKKVLFGALVSLFMILIPRMFPSLGNILLFSIGKKEFFSQSLLIWLGGNGALGTLVYATIPLWKSFVGRKPHWKNELY